MSFKKVFKKEEGLPYFLDFMERLEPSKNIHKKDMFTHKRTCFEIYKKSYRKDNVYL